MMKENNVYKKDCNAVPSSIKIHEVMEDTSVYNKEAKMPQKS